MEMRLNKRGKIALIQILILVLGIVAFGYAIGSSVGVVRGADTPKGYIEVTDRPGTYINPSLKADDSKYAWNPKTNKFGSFTDIQKWELGSTIAGKPIINKNVYVQGSTPSPTGKAEYFQSATKDGKPGYIGGDKAFHELEYSKDGTLVENYEGIWTGMGTGFLGNLAEGLWWSTIVVGGIQLVGNIFGIDGKTLNSISSATFGGIMAGKGFIGGIEQWAPDGFRWGGKSTIGQLTNAQLYGTLVGVAVAAIIFYATYKSESTQIITFECDPWDAPTGGSNCEKCNEQPGDLPCSEYQCRSLGQACELVNPGTEEEKCVWVNRNDVTFPTIEPWEDALLEDYDYTPDNTISPPDRGVKIINKQSTTGCVKAFTPLSFGVILDEPAKCKIDYLRKESFDDMNFYFGGSSLLRYNHTQVMSLPGKDNLASENLTLQNDGNYALYVRCQDANGNHNTANFVFKFCVEEGPDTTPPLIVTTNLLNGMPVAYNTSELDLELYINEPADCKWSSVDQSYDEMEYGMTCSSRITEMNSQMLYKCSTTLLGIKNKQENDFYFRCKDKPSGGEDRNVNAESYKFTVIGTQPLVIDEVGPNETVRDSIETVKVTLTAETSAGYKEGEATCYYSETGDDGDYVMFFYENSDNLDYKHSQDLYLPEGDYKYFIKCIDLGGNYDVRTTEFEVESDSESPIIVRAYHEESYLKIATDEEAECVYGTDTCNYLFEDGIRMTSLEDVNGDETEHYTDWNTKKNFYIKCADEYGNQPLPNECSIIVRPVEIYNEED